MYPEITSYNMTEGAHVILCYVNDISSGLFMYMFFAAIFLILTIGSYQITKRSYGRGDFPVSLAYGAWGMLIASIIFLLIDCGTYRLTSGYMLAVSLALSIISLLFLFTSDDSA